MNARIIAAFALLLIHVGDSRAACSDRPGTPDLVETRINSLSEIVFRWRNTTSRGSPGIVHRSYFDIGVTDESGRDAGTQTGVGPDNVRYHDWSQRMFGGLPPNTTRCFHVRARTGPGTEGCISQVPSARVCARTPTVAIDNVCKAYAKKAYEQVTAIGTMQPTGACANWVGTPRWNPDESAHYDWCVRLQQEGKNSHVIEEQARDTTLRSCKPKPPTAATPKTPTAPPAPGRLQCVAVSVELDRCTNADDGSEQKNWDWRGFSPVCGRGASESEAIDAAIATYASYDIGVSREPDDGQCGFVRSSAPDCVCDRGLISTTAPRIPVSTSNRFLYAVAPDNVLRWQRQSASGAITSTKSVGNGWDFLHVFGSSHGVIYGIDAAGNLRWYRHLGFATGLPAWTESAIVGTGWAGFEQVFSAGDGVIYAVDGEGMLRWYKHEAYLTGDGIETPGAWHKGSQSVVQKDWKGFKRIFAGGDGIIYAITADDRLLWFRHKLYLNAVRAPWTVENRPPAIRNALRAEWERSWEGPREVGQGWQFEQVFSSGKGNIFAVTKDGKVHWYRHLGFETGEASWWHDQGRQHTEIAADWQGITAAFAMLPEVSTP